MSTSSTDRVPLQGGVLAIALALVLAGCAGAPKPRQTTAKADSAAVVKPVREQAAAPVASASETIHVTPVPATPAAQAAAQRAIGEYYSAIQLMKGGKLEDALVILQGITAQHPSLSGPLVNQGLIYIRQSKWEDALHALDAALKTNQQNPYAWNLRGLVLRETGKFADARASYERALALDPLYAKAHFNLAVLADLYLHDLPLALSHYEKYQALQKKPDQAVNNWIADLRNRLNAAQPAPAPAAEPEPAAEQQPNAG